MASIDTILNSTGNELTLVLQNAEEINIPNGDRIHTIPLTIVRVRVYNQDFTHRDTAFDDRGSYTAVMQIIGGNQSVRFGGDPNNVVFTI